VSDARRTIYLFLVLALLALGSVPDGMVYPGLHALTSERYGITISRASWFTLIPTIETIVSAFFLPKLVRSRSPMTVLRVASVLEAFLLAAVALPIPFWAVIVLRLVSGACDLAGIAATLRIATRVAGQEHRARSLGWMGTAIMSGLLGGIALGMFVPTDMVILVAAEVLALLAAGTILIESVVPSVHDPDPPREVSDSAPAPRRQRIVASLLVAADRGLSAVLSIVVPLAMPEMIAGEKSGQTRLVGTILGLSMLGMVFGGPLVGGIVDRVGAARVRLVGAMVFGFGVMAIVFVAPLGPTAMIVAASVAGIGAAPLFASALSIGTHDRTSTGVYGAIQAAGQAGYALGSACLLFTDPKWLGAPETLAAGAILYIAINLAASWVLWRRR
jgi:predicted MFS family arabinose efflux permease